MVLKLQQATIFQQNIPILHQVNLSIEAGEFCYLIGRTGSGKSSLLKTIYGALPLRQGEGFVAGYDLTKLNRSTIPLLRRRLGIMFQDFNLLTDRSMADNLLFVLSATGWKDRAAAQRRIQEVAEWVYLSDKLQKMPHELSGGERQRIVIARALLNTPELIIADEPTGNLDPETSDELMILFRQLSKQHNMAVLFATHDYRIIENFPARIIRCQQGQLIEDENFELK